MAPNVAVSMRSAPASRYARWIDPMSCGRVVASSSRQARCGTPPANSSVPMAPSARSGPAASRWRKRSPTVHEPKPTRAPRAIRGAAPASARRRRASSTCGGRGPAVVRRRQRRAVRAGVADRDEVAARGAAAGGARRARRSIRRSGRGRRPGRASDRPGDAPPSSIGRPSDVSATTSWRAPYSAGRISSVMPASRTTWRPPRVPDVEHPRDEPAGAGDEEPPGLDREPPRPPIRGERVEQRRQLPREPGRRRAPARRAAPTGKPPPTSSVSKSSSPPRTSATQRQRAPDAVPPRVDRAELRPDVEVDAAQAQARRRRRTRRPPRSARSRSGRTCWRRARRPARRGSRARRPG